MRNVVQRCLPVVICAAIWITAVGQESSGSLSGLVIDPKGAVVAGATVTVVLAMPGTTTVGRPRQSSVNGLPKGALNITLDGINVQDNLLKSNDGFFTYVRPRTDAIPHSMRDAHCGNHSPSLFHPGTQEKVEDKAKQWQMFLHQHSAGMTRLYREEQVEL